MKKEGIVIKIYNKIQNFLSLKHITWMTVILFILLLLPVCYLSFFNRASGDDYGYGALTRSAFMHTHSFIEVCKAIIQTIEGIYYSWQGTWFSVILFALQPEVFHDDAYVITAFLMLFLWIGSTFMLFKEILVNQLKFEKIYFYLLTILFLIFEIQYVPSTKSSIYWFNGCAHYLVPFAMGQYLIYLLLRFSDTYKKSFLIWICIFMTLLGGSNYQAALFALIITVYVGIYDFHKKRNKQIFILFIPMLLEMIGLIISFKAPGNKVRGGEEFGLSFILIIETICSSFVKSITDIGTYIKERPIMIIGMIVLFLILLEVCKKRNFEENIEYPIFKIVALFCLNSAMQAPEIYANVEVSSGVLNMNYWTCLLMIFGIFLIIARYITSRMSLSSNDIHKYMVIPGLFICVILAFGVKGNLKKSTTYKCIDYIVTGQAADYKEQMELQTRLLTDESVQNVVVPAMNPEQGPFMHMQIMPNNDAWINTVTRQFYEKESVVSIPRPEWMELYGDS